MVCFTHLLTRVYAWSVVVAPGSNPAAGNNRLDCFKSCVLNTTCSSFFFNRQTSSCYLHDKWIAHLNDGQTPTGYDYFVLFPEHCQLPGYQFVRSVGMCLLFSSKLKSWTSAKQECQSAGARLVKIDRADKLANILKILVSDYTHGHFWIGAEIKNSAHWTWTDGSPVKFAWWAALQPDGSGGCMQIWQNPSGFDDSSCVDEQKYICEIV